MNGVTFEKLECKVEYATVHSPKNKYQSQDKEYQVTALLDDKAMADFKIIMNKHNIQEEVLNPSARKTQSRFKDGENGIKKLTFKRNELKADGSPAKIKVKAADGKTDIPKDILIGNGSTCIIHFFVYQDAKSGEGVFRLSGLQVLDLVEYDAGGSFESREGFSVPESDASASGADLGSPF
jgi:hypothetical protein